MIPKIKNLKGMKIMKKRITTILLTFAIAITGINAPADKANAETSEAKTSAEATTETPTATPAPVTGDIRGNYQDGYEIYNGTEWEKLVRNGVYYDWSGGSLYNGANGWKKPTVGAYRGDNQPYDTEVYTENGWKKVEWKIGDCWGSLEYTIYGWLPLGDERLDDARKAQIAAGKAEEAKKPHDIRIGTFNRRNGEYTMRLEDGDTTEITKGFDTELSFKATGDASPNWTSSNPDVVTIAKTTQNKDKKTAVLTGKNYGTSVVTAEYNGYKISITVKVMKNEYKSNEEARGQGYYGKRRMEYDAKSSMKISYNKKGNLVIKYTEKNFKRKNWKAKAKIVYKDVYVIIRGEGKKIVDRNMKNFRLTVSPKKKTAGCTITIPKKYLKKKTVDLRKCSYFMLKGRGKVVRK